MGGTSANLVRGLVYRLGSARLLLLGSTIVLGGWCSKRALALYTIGISLGGRKICTRNG